VYLTGDSAPGIRSIQDTRNETCQSDCRSAIDFERLSLEKEKFMSYVRAAFLRRVQKDNIVYHGFAGHFFLRDVSNILKVRIIADMELRVREVMEREGTSAKEAKSRIDKIDSGRRKWSRYLYGIDTTDPNLYDMVFRIDNMTVDDVVDSITKAVQLPCFQLSAKSIRLFNDLALDVEVRAHLVEKFPTTRHVSAKDGAVTVLVEPP
jgi:cytidylate kinase